MKKYLKTLLLIASLIALGVAGVIWLIPVLLERSVRGSAESFDSVPYIGGLLDGLEVSSRIEYRQTSIFLGADMVLVTASVTKEAKDRFLAGRSYPPWFVSEDSPSGVTAALELQHELDPETSAPSLQHVDIMEPSTDRPAIFYYSPDAQRLWGVVYKRHAVRPKSSVHGQ